MATTINLESKISAGMLIDVDKYRNKYVINEVDSSTDTKLKIEFISPFIKVYENFKFFLLKNSVIKTLSPKNFYRPDYVAYEEYGTTSLWTLLLFVNDISTIEDFNVSEIYVPDKSVISTLISNIIANNVAVSLDTTDTISSDLLAKLFEKIGNPTLQNTIENATEPQVDDQSYYFKSQTFPVRNITVSQKYVDLRYAAVPESLIFKVKDQPSFIYGVHYTLISNSGSLSRVTWSKRYVRIGLEDIISEGQIIECKYAVTV
jgi:hypothetical protein